MNADAGKSSAAPAAMRRTPDEVRAALKEVLAGVYGVSPVVEDLRRLSVGFSWITWAFDAVRPADGVRERLILRLGPPEGLLAPYSAEPEATIFSALHGSAVPVPRLVAWADAATPFGVPFLICERMSGEALIPWKIGRGVASADERLLHLGRQFIRILADIHRLARQDGKAARLLAGTTPETAANRELDVWEALWRERRMQTHSTMVRALDWLRRNAPTAPEVTVLHGDYRIGNFLVADGDISAILDWEMVHAGDPHQDLAWALFPPFALRRILSVDQVCVLYREAGGCEVSQRSLAYYNVLNNFKMTVINMGALWNFAKGSSDVRLAALGYLVPSHLAQLQRALRDAQ